MPFMKYRVDRVETYLFLGRDGRRVLPGCTVCTHVPYTKGETLSVVTLDWSEIMGTYNTASNIVSER